MLAWNVSIDVINSADYFNVRVDALNGEFIDKDNYTVYENKNRFSKALFIETRKSDLTFINGKKDLFKLMSVPPSATVTSATYNVIPYPYENRFVGNITQVSNPWLNTTGFNTYATSYGWHFDGTNNYMYTRGNNVFAYDDSLNKNAPGRYTYSYSNYPSLTFNPTPDFTQQPTTILNRSFATLNLFYWNNIMHDVFYQYGFDEAAGNFQNDNMGRGGVGGDYVHAEAQDGSGLNNANFSALPDGNTARMQMYLYNSVFNLTISSPASIAGIYLSDESDFSINNKLKSVGSISGQIVYYNDNSSGSTHYACNTPFNNIYGKIALIDDPSCYYTIKVKNAQNAGAIAVIVISSNSSSYILGGTDNTITIPAVVVSSIDGFKIINQLKNSIIVNATLKAGAPLFDGDLDNGVISHEYGHGISNRLTGGPSNTSCLSNAEQGGEGWSDYIALMMTTDWKSTVIKDSNKIRESATYVTDQVSGGLGNRTYPYSTDMTINPHTYYDLANNGEVHYIGEVWCSALWDMTWNIIKQDNYINPNLYDANGGGGNTIALNLVIQGMKYQPCSPGFIDARDAILAADSIIYGGNYHCAIWNAFARRGMGYSAKQGSSNSTTDQTVAFDAPERIAQINGLYEGCYGSNIQLNDSTKGGVWSISNSNAIIDNTGKLTLLKNGMDTVYYSKTNSCNKNVNYIVKIRSLPTMSSISGSSMICLGNNTLLSDSTKNNYEGIYSIKGYTLRAGDSTKTGNIPKSQVILYTKNKTTVEFKNYQIWKDSIAIGIGYPVFNINTATNAVTISSDTSFELYYLGSTVINNPSYNSRYDSSTKSFYISYTWGAGVASRLVTDTITYISPTLNGGIWSSSNTAVATISKTGIVNTLKAGNNTFSYLYTDPFGCSDTVMKVLSINALPNIPPIKGVSNLCFNNTTLFTDSSDVNKYEGTYVLYGGLSEPNYRTYTGVSNSPTGFYIPYFLKSNSYNTIDPNIYTSKYGNINSQVYYIQNIGFSYDAYLSPRLTIDAQNNVKVTKGISADTINGRIISYYQSAAQLLASKYYSNGIPGVTKTLYKKTLLLRARVEHHN